MGDREITKICEYERIRVIHLSRSIRNLVLCLNKKLSDEDFRRTKEDLIQLVEEIY